MARSLSLDVGTAGWLAGVDPALARLPEALDPGGSGDAWRLHDVRWTPGEGCRLAFEVAARGSVRGFVAADVSPSGWTRHDYRADPELPALARAADPVAVAARLTAPAGEHPETCRVEPVRYRPGSRCVLRYDVGPATPPLYAKVLRPDRFEAVSPVSAGLAERAGAGLLVPVAGTWPDVHVLLADDVPGRPLSAVLGDADLPAGDRVHLARRLGALLAWLHDQHDLPAPPWTADDQVALLEGYLAAVEYADPPLGARAARLLDTLADSVPEAGRLVLAHGGFRAGQVLLTPDDRLAVLDLDGVCRSDPARDLGTALAHLVWQRVRLPRHRSTLQVAERALVHGYQDRADVVDPASLSWWRAAGLLQVAARRYRRLEVEAWPLVPELLDAAESMLEPRSTPSVVGAIDLTDPRQMTGVLGPMLSTARSGQAVDVAAAETVATAAGRRSVVRYDVQGLDDTGPVPVLGKAFAEPERAQLLHDHLSRLARGPFREGTLRVPEPLGLLADQGLVLFRPCDGVRLDRITDPEAVEAGVRAAAHWLARMHSSDVRLPRELSLDREAASTRSWARLLGRAQPGLARQARRLSEEWVRAAAAAAVDETVPLHKDFHAGHVIVGDQVAVIDLDEARNGDPAFDVAHFCTYLQVARDPGSAERLAQVFREEYAAATGWTDQGTYAPFCAYTWLKIAKQWALGSRELRTGSRAQRRAGVERALAKGEACLSG